MQKVNYKVYYINLEKDIVRNAFISAQLDDRGLEWERVNAVYGRTSVWSNDNYNSAESIRVNGKDLTEGERGCALSHRLCAEKLISSEYEYAIILEDDVELPDDFKYIAEKVIRKMKTNNLEYVAFDYPQPGIFFIKHWIESLSLSYKDKKSALSKLKFFGYTFLKGLYIIPLSLYEGLRDKFYKNIKRGGLVKFYRPLYFASCYIVSRSGAAKLIGLNTPIVYAADRVQNVARAERGLRWRAYSPLVTRQRREDFGSSLLGVTGEHFKKR